MPTFKCKVATPGQTRVVEKTLTADSRSVLRRHLEDEGHFVLAIQSVGGGGAVRNLWSGKAVRPRDFYAFNQEFSVLIKAGLPVVKALDAIIAKEGESGMNRFLTAIRQDVTQGESLSGAFGKYSHVFSRLYVATLEAGERSGDLVTAISRYMTYMKKTAEIRQKVMSASVYPAILTVVSGFTLLFLLVYVVPAFTQSFFESGSELPFLTLALIQVSLLLREHLLLLLLLFGAGLTCGYFFYRSETGRMVADRWKLRVPFIGDIYRNYATARFARTLSTVISGGIPLITSVQIASGVLDNHFLKQKLAVVTEQVEQGDGFSASLAAVRTFPFLAVRMIDAGESGGALGPVLNDVADFYDSDVNTRLGMLTAAIEPGLMVLMGFLIGFIVLAMYMPIFQLAGTIS